MRRLGRKSGKERQTEGGSRRLLSKEETGSSEEKKRKRARGERKSLDMRAALQGAHGI